MGRGGYSQARGLGSELVGRTAAGRWGEGRKAHSRAGRVGERATRVARPTLPSSNRRCRFPTSGSPENSRLRHAQVPTDGSAPTAPDAATKFLLAEAGTAAGYVVANDGSDGLEHGARSRSRR